jgi:hypothetical protein
MGICENSCINLPLVPRCMNFLQTYKWVVIWCVETIFKDTSYILSKQCYSLNLHVCRHVECNKIILWSIGCRTDVVLGHENITLTIGKVNCSASPLWPETDSNFVLSSRDRSCSIFYI